ncbi:MAG: PD-(D/E)XK nuclease domain-containing protein [Desulfococcaceae bacterium]
MTHYQKRDEALHVAEVFYHSGDMGHLCDFIEQGYFRAFDNRDYRWSNELTVKTVFLTLLFNDLYYITDSETALEREYADFTMILRPDMRKYELLDFLIEFKYVSLKESELGGEEIRKKSSSELKMLPPVKKKMAEAKSKLEKYRKILSESYGDVLRLRVFSVTAIGFEKLLWEEL